MTKELTTTGRMTGRAIKTELGLVDGRRDRVAVSVETAQHCHPSLRVGQQLMALFERVDPVGILLQRLGQIELPRFQSLHDLLDFVDCRLESPR